MARLVSQLLLLAKADAGQLGIHREKTDLRVLASEAIEIVPKPEGVKLETRFPEHAAYAEVDSDAIRRVVGNLLENAYRHTPSGTVQVAILEGPILEVSDTGPGIASEHLPHLTERFYRADASRAGATGGSGLGLAICKTILEGHGGRLEIESELGKGTRVRAIF
jgi:signal transduction histidine kinase